MTTLALDWETTGKWIKSKQKHEDPLQPKPTQLAAILVDDDLSEIASINVLVYPAKWEIPVEASNIHGITQERAEKFGVALPDVMNLFLQLAEVADKFIAHNIEFDENITRHALHTCGIDIDPFEGKELRCTMKAAKPVLKLPNRNTMINDPYKFPKLEECHKHFFNEGINGAHNALVDVQATIRVYRALCDHYGMKY